MDALLCFALDEVGFFRRADARRRSALGGGLPVGMEEGRRQRRDVMMLCYTRSDRP